MAVAHRLTFVGAFVPILGATVSGGVAVAVTLVLDGERDAVIAFAVVQQLEGNVLQPLIMGRALRLHPLVILCAATAGWLLLGVAGALLAVPLTAVVYSAASALRSGSPDGEEHDESGQVMSEQVDAGCLPSTGCRSCAACLPSPDSGDAVSGCSGSADRRK